MSAINVAVVRTLPRSADAVGIAVASTGPVPRQLGMNRAALEAHGFNTKVGSTLVVPGSAGTSLVAVGIGDSPTAAQLRDAAAAFTRAAGKRAHIATNLVEASGLDPAVAGRAVTEGVLLANYRYLGRRTDQSGVSTLTTVSLAVAQGAERAASKGVAHGVIAADAANLARDLANMPPNDLTARAIAQRAQELAADHGLAIEVFDRDQLATMGCGGILGVNAGSLEPPRMVKLTYTPRTPRAHVAFVGKGVMYDSGGLSLKPTNPMSVLMKMDMSGAAAVLGAMTSLKALGCRNKVTAYLMCTDNMPSGSAVKLGDVLTFRNGKTAEIHNTDAEGRLILADGLSLAAEEQPDAIVDIATLTGAALAALGADYAAVIGSSADVVRQIELAAEVTDESVWELPLARDKYRKHIDSLVADMKNVGGPYAGATTAAIFLSEFVGDVPWAHIDMAGPMNVESDSSWRSKGATGFGTRLLIEFATTFTPAI